MVTVGQSNRPLADAAAAERRVWCIGCGLFGALVLALVGVSMSLSRPPQSRAPGGYNRDPFDDGNAALRRTMDTDRAMREQREAAAAAAARKPTPPVIVADEDLDPPSDFPPAAPASPAVSADGARPRVRCETTRGPFVLELRPDLAAHGVQRILRMVDMGFFDDRRAAGQPKFEGVAFFRVNSAITQFGASKYRPAGLQHVDWWKLQDNHPQGGEGRDDASKALRKANPWPRGTIASIGGTQMVIVRKANRQMGTSRHDASAGRVVEGMESVIDKLFAYNDIIDNRHGGPGVDQGALMSGGMKYIEDEFPKTDRITSCQRVGGSGAAAAAAAAARI